MPYEPASRNYEGVRHQRIREGVDDEAMRLHDSVSAAYYDGEEFSWAGVDFGMLDKETFDQIHALSEDIRLLLFHYANSEFRANASKDANSESRENASKDAVPEEAYRYSRTTNESGDVVNERDKIADAQSSLDDFMAEYDVSLTYTPSGKELPEPAQGPISLEDLRTFTL